MNKIPFVYLLLMVGIFGQQASAQSSGAVQADGKRINSIYTAMPFLLIAPDARSGGMGDVGVAISPDVNSTHWNPAKLAFVDQKMAFSLSYTPWLRNIVKDVSLSYVSAYRRLDERNTVGFSLRYFSMGSIQQIDVNENNLGTASPAEFSFDGSLARKFGEQFSMGVAFRYMRSQLSNGQFAESSVIKPASAFGADVSAFYRDGTQLFGKDALLALGLNISNITTKVSYVDNTQKYFLPTNMKLGGAATFLMDDINKLTIALDFNKLMVPTTPEMDTDGNILRGKRTDRSVFAGMIGSFADAPGGFGEELREISYSFGLEYLYADQFALRSGFFYEHPTKGGRQFFTAGTGFNYKKKFSIDFSYLIANQQSSSLDQIFRFSLLLNLKNN